MRPAGTDEPPSESPELALAHDAYANLRPADARTLLDALLTRADATGALGLERPELLDALLTLSLACRALGDGQAADAALDRAVAIDPSITPSLTQFPPALVQALAERRAAGAGSGRVVIAIGPLPNGAHVLVDAQRVVPNDARIETPRGTHLLRVEAPGRVAWSARVEVGDAPVEVTPELAVDADGLLREPGPPREGGYDELDRAAQSLGARAFVVDVWARGATVRLRARDSLRARVATATMPASVRAEAAARELLSRLEPPRSAPSALQPRGAPVWPWIAGGSGAVAIVVTVVAIVLATSGSSTPSGFFARGER